MNFFSASAAEGDKTFSEDIIGFFRSLSDLGDEWGRNWGFWLPILVAVFFALVVVSGFRYVTQQLEQGIFKPLLLGVVGIAILLAVVAVNNESPLARENLGDTSATTVQP